ncbi:MAG: nicotinamide-nucleotide amidohydrolase family protein [Sulfurovum sp.]|nr:nicotinamide-nucleotide amidohydrolase family protein [Sulfurovum sp.]
MKTNHTNVKKIIEELTTRKQSISFAESCTGGQIAAAFTSISGASAVLNGSMVTYSNEIKHSWLGVEQKVLETFGAVSKECVSQMLAGIQKTSGADYVLAVSGIAGPTGGTDEKPVGTVYIGIKSAENEEVNHCLFKGDRASIQAQSTAFAIQKLEEVLEI